MRLKPLIVLRAKTIRTHRLTAAIKRTRRNNPRLPHRRRPASDNLTNDRLTHTKTSGKRRLTPTARIEATDLITLPNIQLSHAAIIPPPN